MPRSRGRRRRILVGTFRKMDHMKRPLLLSAAALLLLGAAEPQAPPAPLAPAEAAKQGKAIVAELLSQRPAQNVANTGVLKIQEANGRRTDLPVTFESFSTATNWQSVCSTTGWITNENDRLRLTLTITHDDARPNQYELQKVVASSTTAGRSVSSTANLAGAQTMIPFAGSDFCVADLGLEFFHWPEQRLVKTEMRRGRSCRVLESVNPQPDPGAYSRVVSWIDIETGGIVHAEAYDSQNKLLKEFDPKEFKKMQGQWQLQEVEIRNRQTGSRTRIEFNLDRN